MIEKEERWVPHELKSRGDVERRLFACEQLVERQTRKEFLHLIVTGAKNGYISITPSAQKIIGIVRWSYRYNSQHPSRISMAQKSCFAFGRGTILA
nr:Mariner Mos1 transposase [Hymenolepis microstoma]CUU99037.1 Mariner Mos1 transposase [Hymenolepis microstoma]